MTRRVVIVALGLMAAAISACHRTPGPAATVPQPGPMTSASWAALDSEALGVLQQYLRINTTNPPGNEIQAARFLQRVLARDGITAQIFEPAPGKANLVARLAGDGSQRPVVLLNHMDVVEASPQYWSVDPFGGVIRDGYLFGRGAEDMKGQAIAQLMAMVTLKRAHVPLTRDIVFVATSDEEVGGGVGARWIATERPDLVRGAEFLITEGGAMREGDSGRVQYVGVGVTEKAPFWLDVTAHGIAGHGSRPTPNNSVERLLRALGRIRAWADTAPIVVTPTAERFLHALATGDPDLPHRAWLLDVRGAQQDSAARAFFSTDPGMSSLLRNTISITVLSAGNKVNVIPPVARAQLDVRLLPGQDAQRYLAQMREAVRDTAVTIEPQGVNWPATESGIDNPLYRAIQSVTDSAYPGALLTPMMLAGFTDSHYFRTMGIVSYGLQPFPTRAAEERGIHGNDERVAVSAPGAGARFLFAVLSRIASR